MSWIWGKSKEADENLDKDVRVWPTKNALGQELVLTQEELQAFYRTRDLLLSPTGGHALPREKLSVQPLFLATMNCKLRPEKAAKKYALWLKTMEPFGINSFDDITAPLSITRDGGGSEEGWEILRPIMTAFAGCGLDKEGRSIMWIRARPTQLEEEQNLVRGSDLYYTAIHGDLKSLREGITFVLDIEKGELQKRTGNEDKMQRFNQAMPLRPQTIYILGATYLKRVLINAIISLASLFTSEKVLDRIRFADLEEVKTKIDISQMPAYYGGGCTIDTNDKLFDWVRQRLAKFPPLPDLFPAEEENRL